MSVNLLGEYSLAEIGYDKANNGRGIASGEFENHIFEMQKLGPITDRPIWGLGV